MLHWLALGMLLLLYVVDINFACIASTEDYSSLKLSRLFLNFRIILLLITDVTEE
jgi:hypothetical protein